MSTNSTAAGTSFAAFDIAARASNRSSGTLTIPKFGSIVQKGKFEAYDIDFYTLENKQNLKLTCAELFSTSALKSVLLPTFGKPGRMLVR